jgi:hypothetical protein
MVADDLQLQAGVRLLHIGPHKTGTTMIQDALHLARERLAAQGVVYPGTGRQPLRAMLAVTGQPTLLGEPQPDMADWDLLVREVTGAHNQRVVVSSEFLAEASEAAACRVVRDLGGPRVHVVVTLRPLTRILPSQWQQYLQNGYRFPYLEWLEGILKDPPDTPTPGFWRRHRHDELVARWMKAAQNLTVVVVDDDDRMMLLRTFESMLGLPRGFLVPGVNAANRSLTLAEAEVVRRLNEEFRRRKWPNRHYARFVRYGAVQQMKTRQPEPGEPRISTPVWALKRATEIGAQMAENIAALGVPVIGDLSSLCDLPEMDNEPAPPVLPADAAVQAIVGAFHAGGVAGLKTADALRDIDARSMTRVLAQRGRQRMQRTLRLRKALGGRETGHPR